MRELKIQKKYHDYIRAGRKTLEIRINKSTAADLREGERFKFVLVDSTEEGIEVFLVKKHGVYKSFDELLEKQPDFKKYLPDEDTPESCINLLRSLGNYAEEEKQFGVVALEITDCD